MIAMRYLFWNTHKNEQINPVLCDLIIENGISVVVLAEYSADMNDLIETLRTCGVSMQQIPSHLWHLLHLRTRR